MMKRLGSIRSYVNHSIHTSFNNEQSSNDHIIFLCKQKLFKRALETFELLQRNTSFSLYPSTYAQLVSACSSLRSLQYARKVHNHILSSNYQPDMIFQNHLLNMYGKCGSLSDARKMFDEMLERNLVSWTSIIAGYSQNGQEKEAVDLYFRMRQCGLIPDQFTFGSVIKACSYMNQVELGKLLHGHVIKSEPGSHLIAQNALIAMYTKFSRINEALAVFLRIKSKDLISWSSMVAGYSQLGYELEALSCFREMLGRGIYKLNEFIFGSVFSACRSLAQAEYGRQIHGLSIKFGLSFDAFVGCAVTDMYARCGWLRSARTAFYQIGNPDLVSWNALIAGFAYGGDPEEAISLFSQMRTLRLTPDDVTVRSLLCAFVSPSALFLGKQVHCYVIKSGFDLEISVSNTLLSTYANCSDLPDAYKIFNEIQNKADLVSWNAILTAFLQQSESGEVFSLFKMMLLSSNKPDHITLVNMLGASGKVASLEVGDQVCCYAMKNGLSEDICVMNALIDMYVKCGNMTSSRKLFDSMKNPDAVSWSSLIVGYAQFGYGEEALDLFQKMRYLAVKPNQVTFVGVLTACSHVGRVKEGWQLFRAMETEFGIVPTREHCCCVVDMLARAGCIEEAEAFINQMELDPDIVMWKTLLAACKTRNNLDVGKRAAEKILEIDPSNSAAHVLLCNIFASTGSWKDVASLRGLMRQKGVKKVPGQSWIEVKDRIHVFLAEDCMHPKRDRIYSMLDELWLQMLDDDYLPLHI
ncbi:pentatricopeptide repeat-containing protein At3g53360, mitochondrial-like [Nicotiana tabacum]|uniref:Pentatricopeptide repeat-containing protein At3g53360, mitochondrial-like n=1 Tax=Nicotiana tabacum TaxID=4097 RepID=A0A1S4B128_TOBAC|nr:PREDICTED: pentatricopeptide repeat-containing protein At3g53360, mitochondrial-like [Nicotiana tabacum]